MNSIIFLEESLSATELTLTIALYIVGGLIGVLSVFALVVSIYLSLKYFKYNRIQNSCGMTGEEVCRRILDENDLEHIRVSPTGSILFGNSYSHYFKKVRLRRFTYKKQSVTSLAMAGQKASLAILDKENDIDMKRRVRLTPVVIFGPYAFIPLLIVGLIIDILLFSGGGLVTILSGVLGLLFFILSYVCSFMELKTEKKAQAKALEIFEKNNLANEEEREMMKSLFKLYNIEYINNMIIAMLELIYYILQIALSLAASKSSSKS